MKQRTKQGVKPIFLTCWQLRNAYKMPDGVLFQPCTVAFRTAEQWGTADSTKPFQCCVLRRQAKKRTKTLNNHKTSVAYTLYKSMSGSNENKKRQHASSLILSVSTPTPFCARRKETTTKTLHPTLAYKPDLPPARLFEHSEWQVVLPLIRQLPQRDPASPHPLRRPRPPASSAATAASATTLPSSPGQRRRAGVFRLRHVEHELCILRAYRRHHEHLAEDHTRKHRSTAPASSAAGGCGCGAAPLSGAAGLERWPRGCFVTLSGVPQGNDDRCRLSNRCRTKGCERGGGRARGGVVL